MIWPAYNLLSLCLLWPRKASPKASCEAIAVTAVLNVRRWWWRSNHPTPHTTHPRNLASLRPIGFANFHGVRQGLLFVGWGTSLIKIQSVSKKRYFGDFLISVLEVRFYFFTCVSESEFRACFIYLVTHIISIQNLNCPKNAKNACTDMIFIPTFRSEAWAVSSFHIGRQ